jgi:hypothetical protein
VVAWWLNRPSAYRPGGRRAIRSYAPLDTPSRFPCGAARRHVRRRRSGCGRFLDNGRLAGRLRLVRGRWAMSVRLGALAVTPSRWANSALGHLPRRRNRPPGHWSTVRRCCRMQFLVRILWKNAGLDHSSYKRKVRHSAYLIGGPMWTAPGFWFRSPFYRPRFAHPLSFLLSGWRRRSCFSSGLASNKVGKVACSMVCNKYVNISTIRGNNSAAFLTYIHSILNIGRQMWLLSWIFVYSMFTEYKINSVIMCNYMALCKIRLIL